MTVKEFTKIINENIEHQENAPLEFWIGDKEYDIASMSNYSILPNVMIHLKPIDTPILRKV